MTLSDLLAHLSDHDPEAGLVFTADGVAIHGGYHVTEFQQADIRAMDCGGRPDAWSETRLQLLDGDAGARAPMVVGKFLAIAARVAQGFPDMGGHDLKVEFAPENRGLGVYNVAAPMAAPGTVTVPLVSSHAVCKPALAARGAGATASCCGAGAARCC
ncbi:MAG: DUF6428 family protein [Pseudomonadota bacterium]